MIIKYFKSGEILEQSLFTYVIINRVGSLILFKTVLAKLSHFFCQLFKGTFQKHREKHGHE